MRQKEVTAVLINDPETMKIVNRFALKENRTPTNAARELIKRSLNPIADNTNELGSNSQPQSATG